MSCKETLTVIIGNGYLSGFLIPLLTPSDVVALNRVRSLSRQDKDYTNVTQIDCDVFSESSLERLEGLIGTRPVKIYCLLPPSAYGGKAASIALEPFFKVLDSVCIKGLVVTSSTAVYGDEDREVSRLSSEDARTERASFLLQIENAWRSFYSATRVVRLAGLYGPGRIIGKAAVQSGTRISGSGAAWLNLIRVEDAAVAVHATMSSESPEKIYLISDGNPVIRSDYYGYLHSLTNKVQNFVGEPVFENDGAGGKRCISIDSWQCIGRKPCFPNYKTSLSALLEVAN
jgi:nucleoside-diphosphate-sugar epimerase